MGRRDSESQTKPGGLPVTSRLLRDHEVLTPEMTDKDGADVRVPNGRKCFRAVSLDFCGQYVSQMRHILWRWAWKGSNMAAQTSMLHVRVDNQLKAQAAEKLAGFGLTVSDAVRILLTRVVKEGALPAGFTADNEAYDGWFRAKVREALADMRPAVSNEQAMEDAQALIDRKHRLHAGA